LARIRLRIVLRRPVKYPTDMLEAQEIERLGFPFSSTSGSLRQIARIRSVNKRLATTGGSFLTDMTLSNVLQTSDEWIIQFERSHSVADGMFSVRTGTQ
jgi:hypothetical protein